ncbi:hypothetical protein CsSME_00040689 [Camellia sinensis var. sinensis]
MSSTLLCITIICLVLLLSPLDVTMARSLGSRAQEDVTMKPLMDHKKQVFRGKEVKDCMPKGSRRSSAPSRFVNYHTMGSFRCSTGKDSRKP